MQIEVLANSVFLAKKPMQAYSRHVIGQLKEIGLISVCRAKI